MALRVAKLEHDTKYLGRWCSMKIRGKHGTHLRIVSTYVPIVTKSHGNKTVHAQQHAALLRLKETKPVITTFWTDFWKQIDKWLADGEKLVINGDWNQHVQSDALVKAFEARNLIPVVTGGRHEGDPPETYNKGSYPIDECFASAELRIKKCGYLRHGDNGGDHRPLWLDIEKESALGHNLGRTTSHSARRLKTNDPRIVAKYNAVLEEEFDKCDIYNRSLALYNRAMDTQTSWSQEDGIEYDKLDKLRDKAMKKAEKKCRKLHMGAVPWTPEMGYIRKKIHYIKLVIRRKKGRKVSARTLIRLQKKLGFS